MSIFPYKTITLVLMLTVTMLSGRIYFLQQDIESYEVKVLDLTSRLAVSKSNEEGLTTTINDQNTAIDKLKKDSEDKINEFNRKLEDANKTAEANKTSVVKILTTQVDKSCEGSMKWLLKQSAQQSQW